METSLPQKRKLDEEGTSAGASAGASAAGTSASTPVPPDAGKKELEQMEEHLSHGKWVKKIDAALEANKDVEETFEGYLKWFCNDGKMWAKYIDWEMESSGKDGGELDKKKIESQFSQTLTQIFDVELWRTYLKYVQKINPVEGENGEMARSIVLKAFNFAADKIGLDFLNSESFWNDYIHFLNSWKPQNANEAETRISLTREVMRRMISTPNKNLEDNWKMYIRFENDTDQTKGRRLINERSVDFMKLRPLNQELYSITKSLKESNERRHAKKQLEHFARWTRWEEENKLKLTDEQAKQRRDYVHRLATQYLRFQPEVWYNYASFLMSEHKEDEALALLQNGLRLNPLSLSLTYQIASYYDQSSDLTKVKETWQTLIKWLTAEYTRAKEDKKAYYARLTSSAYSLFMKQVKRMGTIKDVRYVFSLARKFEAVTWQVYVTYALIEYRVNDLRVALRSLELAMRYFGKDYDFISAYINILVNIKDMTNCKKVLEVALDNLKDDKASLRKLFERYLQIEMEFGDTNSIKNLERRFIESFPDHTPFDLTITGFKSDFDSFNPALRLDEYASEAATYGGDSATGGGASSVGVSPSSSSSLSSSSSKPSVATRATSTSDDDSEHPKKKEKKSAPKEPFSVRDEVYNILRVLPRAEYYDNKPTLFDTEKTVNFFANLDM